MKKKERQTDRQGQTDKESKRQKGSGVYNILICTLIISINSHL